MLDETILEIDLDGTVHPITEESPENAEEPGVTEEILEETEGEESKSDEEILEEDDDPSRRDEQSED